MSPMPPPHNQLAPVHRLIGATLIFMFLAFGLWATFGELDIVVSAQGKLVPTTFVKVSQPVEAGSVVELLVRDGQVVQAGELLARLDSTAPQVDQDALSTERTLLTARLSALSGALAGAPGADLQGEVHAEFALRLNAQQQARLAAQAAHTRAGAELAATQETLSKQRRLLALAERTRVAHKDLQHQGFVSELAYQDKLQVSIEREQDIKTLESTVRANQAGVLQASAQAAQVNADYARQLAQERTQTLTQLQRVEADLAKATHRIALAQVRAPVAGVINSLNVRAVGQVVGAGSALMAIVPADEPLIAEVWVRNEDAGFVAPGTPSKVKLAAFAFQKYGWLQGEVTWVGADSEVPESMRNAQGEPLFYKARVRLESQALTRNGTVFPARAGMQAQVDILLGQRSLLEYLTSPLKRVVLEAARER